MAPSFKKHLINMYRVVFPKKQEGVYDIDKDKYEIAGLARGLEPGQKRGFYLLEPPSDIALERLIMTISQYGIEARVNVLNPEKSPCPIVMWRKQKTNSD